MRRSYCCGVCTQPYLDITCQLYDVEDSQAWLGGGHMQGPIQPMEKCESNYQRKPIGNVFKLNSYGLNHTHFFFINLPQVEAK